MRKLIVISTLLFAMINVGYAQLQGQARIDSLLKELPKAKIDTNQVNLLTDLSFNYYFIDPDKGIEYGEKGLELAKKLSWKEGEANCYNSLGTNYNEKSDYPKAIEYYHKALKIFEELGDKSRVAIILGNIGVIYYHQSDYPKTIEFYNKSLKIREELRDKSGIANILGNIGIVYQNQSDYPKALEYYHKSLKIKEELGNKSSSANTLGNIGIIYKNQSDYFKALEYFNKALLIYEELGNKSGISSMLSNIGMIYTAQSEYTKALECFNKALKISEEIGNKSLVALILGNIGDVYLSQSNYPKSLEYFQKALKINEELGRKSGIAKSLGNIGQLYFSLSQDSVIINPSELNQYLSLNKVVNLIKSIDYLLQSITIYEEIGELTRISEIYHILSDAYSAKGDYKKAYEAFKEYKTLQDSVFSMEKSKEIANLEAKRENELKDKEIELLNSEKKAQTMRSYLMGGGIVVLLGAFGLAFLRYREKRKLSNELTYKNTQILDSIDYASTIQHAILPWKTNLDKAFPEYFILFKPKDIVSGDCYWFKEVDGVNFLAVIDCTGHGVPGSMLTVIATSVLDDAVLNKKLSDTAEILTYMNTRVTEVLNQRLEENKSRDGMEVCLVAIHQDKIQYSGAGRPLFVKNGEIRAYKTDRRGIAGSRLAEVGYIFNSEIINARPGITLYLSSDGYSDQLSADNKKMGKKNFRELLEKISDYDMIEQKAILEKEYTEHKGNQDQTDDVTILGVKI